jgi:hypothetical protein
VNQPQKGRIRPNTFPTPNEHVDLAMEMLTPEEYKVLNFAIRHTWGWHVDQKAISVTTFTHGYGPYRGVGMSRTTVLKCLSELSRMEFLVPVGKADADGQVWAVGLDPNIEALEQRYGQKKAKSQQIMSPVRAQRGKSKTAVYDTDQSMRQTDSGLSGRPASVYGVDAIKDTPKDTSKDKKKKETTSAATHQNAVSSPDNDWSLADEAGDNAMFTPLTGKQKSARADNSAKRLQNATATTPPPSPTPSAPAPEMVNVPPALTGADGTETGKAKKERKVNEGYELGIALGDAWGIPPAKSEINLYIKQAKALALDVPVEEFKMFCDWRKADAGDWAKNLTIKTLLGSGHVSKYLQERDALKQQEEAHKRLLETIPADMLPRIVPMEQRASQEQIDAALAKFRTPIFTSSDSGEKIS